MAKRRNRAPKSRARMIEIRAKLGRNGATAAEMIAAVQEKYPEIIRAENPDLIHLGLVTIVNAVCNLKGCSGFGLQADLFREYDVPPTLTLRQHNGGGAQNIKKNFDALTKAELREYIHVHTAPKQSRRTAEIARFFEFIEDHGTDDWTVRRCLKAALSHSAAM